MEWKHKGWNRVALKVLGMQNRSPKQTELNDSLFSLSFPIYLVQKTCNFQHFHDYIPYYILISLFLRISTHFILHIRCFFCSTKSRHQQHTRHEPTNGVERNGTEQEAVKDYEWNRIIWRKMWFECGKTEKQQREKQTIPLSMVKWNIKKWAIVLVFLFLPPITLTFSSSHVIKKNT